MLTLEIYIPTNPERSTPERADMVLRGVINELVYYGGGCTVLNAKGAWQGAGDIEQDDVVIVSTDVREGLDMDEARRVLDRIAYGVKCALREHCVYVRLTESAQAWTV